MADYDIGEAFREIENELIGSMTRNLSGHRAQEIEQGYEWAQWQVMQLEALEEYRRRNAEKMPEQFGKINERIQQEIKTSYNDAQTAQEREILKILKRVHSNTPEPNAAQTGAQTIQGEFFKVNDRKLDALINATTNDMQRAEYAVLRMTNDQYRSIIFNAQVYANTGAGTYAKAVDMATRDFLSAGINCIEYQNGRRVNISAYAEMALRTASKRAYLQGEGETRQKWGIHTVIMNKRTNACPKCAPFAGRVIVDDVWSGGTREEAEKGGYLLMSECIAQGLYHPNCQDSHSTYYGDFLSDDEGGETAGAAKGEMSEDYAQESPARKRKRKQQQQEYTNEELLQAYTPEELERNVRLYNAEQQENYCGRQVRRFERLSEFSIDTDNKREYEARLSEWEERLTEAEKAAEKLRKRVAKFAESGIINVERFNSIADPMYEVTGSAFDSNPKEVQQIIDTLKEWGVELSYGSSTLGYGCTRIGYPGGMSITKEASYSAWCHEFQHVKDDREAGWNGLEVLWFKPEERVRRERRAYAIEIQLARKAGREDIAKRLEENLNDEIRKIYNETEVFIS